MKSSIKIIKRKPDEKCNQNEDSAELTNSEGEKSAERSRREMVTTVKSWIAELQKRKSAQVHSFSHLPVTATAPANQNT